MNRTIKFIVAAWVALGLFAGGAAAISISSAPDPYFLTTFFGEGNISTVNVGYKIPGVRAPVGKPTDPNTAYIVYLGQSLSASSAQGTPYITTQATSYNYNIYDGMLYPCVNPVLGASYEPILGPNSPSCTLADDLIVNGIYSTVVMVPIGIGGSSCAMWQGSGDPNAAGTNGAGNGLKQRIIVTMTRLASIGVTPTWIMWHQGETDNAIGTGQVAYTNCVTDVAKVFVDNGSGTARFFVSIETLLADVVSPALQAAQFNAGGSGLYNMRVGPNWDSLTSPLGYRNGGLHFSATGYVAGAALDYVVIRDCKATSC